MVHSSTDTFLFWAVFCRGNCLKFNNGTFDYCSHAQCVRLYLLVICPLMKKILVFDRCHSGGDFSKTGLGEVRAVQHGNRYALVSHRPVLLLHAHLVLHVVQIHECSHGERVILRERTAYAIMLRSFFSKDVLSMGR